MQMQIKEESLGKLLWVGYRAKQKRENGLKTGIIESYICSMTSDKAGGSFEVSIPAPFDSEILESLGYGKEVKLKDVCIDPFATSSNGFATINFRFTASDIFPMEAGKGIPAAPKADGNKDGK